MPRTSELLDPTPDPDTGLTAAERQAALMKLGAYGLDAREIDLVASAAIAAARKRKARTTDELEWACKRFDQGWTAADTAKLLGMDDAKRAAAIAFATREVAAGRRPRLAALKAG